MAFGVKNFFISLSIYRRYNFLGRILFSDLGLGWQVRTNETPLIDSPLVLCFLFCCQPDLKNVLFQRPWFHISKMSKKVGFIGIYLTISQCLAKNDLMLGVSRMSRCVMEKLMKIWRFNKKICRKYPIILLCLSHGWIWY